MSYLFGISIAVIPAIFVYVFYRLIPQSVWITLPVSVLRWKEPAARIVSVLVFLVILATNFSAYGPRVELPNSMHAPAPERADASFGADFTAHDDRFGAVDDKLEQPPKRAAITDALRDGLQYEATEQEETP